MERDSPTGCSMKTPKEYFAAIGAKGGKKSRRKLTTKQARDMVKARERKRAERLAEGAK